jgi:tetratricopeptide (TPR) repeat protein
MSSFLPDEPVRPPEEGLPPQPNVNPEPSSPKEFVRRKRKRIRVRRTKSGFASRAQSLKWVIGGVIATLLMSYYLYRLSIPGEARKYYIAAKESYDAGKYSNALYAVNEALRDRGQRLDAYRLRAEIYRAMLQPKKAVADITRVIELQPGVPEYYDFRAQTYLELDDSASAAKDYTKVIALKTSGQAYYGRGLCYLKLNDTRKAIDDFTKAIELDPKVEFYLQRGLAWSTVGDHKAAMLDFDRGLEMQSAPSMPLWYCYRARAAEKQKLGDAAGAAQDRQKAARMQTVLGYTDVR